MDKSDGQIESPEKMDIENDILTLDFKKSTVFVQEDTKKVDEPKPNEFFEDFRITE